ncbi:MAG: ubiquinone/menaquinone biosynthesis methyltransferase [Candidatus Woesearchaeota archaeon]
MPKKSTVKIFNTISNRYDIMNKLITFGLDIKWRKKVSYYALKNNPARVLDLATGTADLALELTKINSTIKVYAVDPSKKMLEIALKKILKNKKENQIKIIKSNSEKLPFKSNYFNTITISFGIRNFSNIHQSLSEIYRVLNKNGNLVILETAIPTNIISKIFYKIYISTWFRLIAFIFSNNYKAYSYLINSSQKFPYDEAFINILNKKFSNSTFYKLFPGVATIYFCTKK